LVWIACRAIKTTAVEALQQDAETDCIFNVFSILFPFVGTLVGFKYLDAIGGAVLSLYSKHFLSSLRVGERADVRERERVVMINWTKTLLENVRKLTGRRAPPQEHQVRSPTSHSVPLLLRNSPRREMELIDFFEMFCSVSLIF